jgi:hypothetical protein
MTQENQLITVGYQTGLEENKVKSLMQRFNDSFSEAKSISEQSKSIVVTDETQTDKMLEARTSRLKLRDIRVSVEKIRVELKEQSLREGKAIDGMANIIKALIIPVEQHLEKQEKFAEEKEKLRIDQRNIERIAKLQQYVPDTSIYNVKDMSDLAFDSLLNTCKTAYEATKKAEAEAEKQRLAAEEAKKKEDEKVRKDNDRLRALREKDRIKMQKLKDEKEEMERKERAKKLAEEKRIQEEKEKQAKLLRAPDAEQYKIYVSTLFHVQAPAVKDPEIAQKIRDVVRYLLTVNEEAKNI